MGDLTVQLEQQIQHAYATKTPLKIRGGNTKASLGRETSGEAMDIGRS